MPRRAARLVAAAVALATLGFGTACGTGSGGGATVQLTYVSYGGAAQDAMIEAWQKPYAALHPGVRFVNTFPPDPAQVKAQVEIGAVSWNIVSTAPALAIRDCDTLYEKLSVPDLDADQFPANAHGECFIADSRYALVFSYSAERWPDPASAPTKIEDFFDIQRFPGKRAAVPALMDGILEFALLADGVGSAELYPLDVDRALRKYDTIRADLIWAASPAALLEIVTSRQADMQIFMQSWTRDALDAEATIVPVWDRTVTGSNGMAIPKGSPFKAEIEEFMSFVLEPGRQAAMAELSGLAPSNLAATPNHSDNGRTVDAFGPANTGATVAVDPAWWAQNLAGVAESFAAWRSA